MDNISKFLNTLRQDHKNHIQEHLLQHPPPAHFWKNVNLQWLRGFIQGDGTFNVCFIFKGNRRSKIRVKCQFGITQNKRSIYALLGARQLLGTGGIYLRKDQTYYFLESSYQKLIDHIINPFSIGGFYGKRQFGFQFVNQVIKSQVRGVHSRNFNGLLEIMSTAVNSNNTYRKYNLQQLLSFVEMKLPRNEVYFTQQQYKHNKIIPWPQSYMSEQFVTGFTDAEGCFIVRLHTSIERWPLVQIQLQYKLCAEVSEVDILHNINQQFFFNTGKIYFDKHQMAELRFTRKEIINQLVIPFFVFNPLLSSKYYDFEKFVTIAMMINSNKHKSIEGVKKIIELAYNMNSGKDGQKSRRRFSLSQLIQYVDIAPNRQTWRKIKSSLPALKKQILVSKYQ